MILVNERSGRLKALTVVTKQGVCLQQKGAHTFVMKHIERIIQGFPHPKINLIIETQTYETLEVVTLKLNANTAFVHSELGNGQFGLLSLMFTAPVYITLIGVSFAPSVNPPQVVIPPGSTGPQIAASQASHIKKQENGESTSQWTRP